MIIDVPGSVHRKYGKPHTYSVGAICFFETGPSQDSAGVMVARAGPDRLGLARPQFDRREKEGVECDRVRESNG